MGYYRYHIYGFNIASDLDLPGLPETDRPEQVSIKHMLSAIKPLKSSKVSGDMEEMILELAPTGIFTVRGGREIIVEICEDANLDWVRAYLIGTVLGALLYQRGYLLFHASCVSLQGQACLFAGQVGLGKSTLASNLLLLGGKMLADDITAIKMIDGVPMVQPGFPMMRLKPENAELIFGTQQRVMPKQVTKYDKKCYIIDSMFENERRPLKNIYFLQFGPENSFAKILGPTALFQCMPYLYVSLCSDPTKQVPAFKQLVSILSHVNVYHFTRIHGIQNIIEGCKAVVSHMNPSQDYTPASCP